MKNYYLSANRLEELKQELQELKTIKRIEVAERLKRAKEYGDLSENAEYSEAREQQEALESRIDELEDIVKNASVIKKSSSQEVIDLGCEVEVEYKGKTRIFTIVGSNEAKPEEGRISNDSPIGRAIIGKKVGDSVKVLTPAGEITYKILKIS
ncbi:MAG: transcription elongation factor GreA [Parcubacteria group bacterium]